MAKTKKYLEFFCTKCGKKTKMSKVGEIEGVEEKIWFRCTRCKQLALLETKKTSSDSESDKKNDSRTYMPELVYHLGEIIYHNGWDDTGKVVKKETTSDGSQAILVMFEKSGERRLLENFKSQIDIESVVDNNNDTTKGDLHLPGEEVN